MVAKGDEGEEWIGILGLANANYYIYRMDSPQVLLYSTGNYIQYLGINHSGKVYKCMTESLYCIAEISTTL